MEGKKKIFSIAFEGMHRSGKGTQMELLKNKLNEMGVPCISTAALAYESSLKEDQEKIMLVGDFGAVPLISLS